MKHLATAALTVLMAVPMIAGRPSGLMTDLIGDPGLVSCGQMVEIRSSSPRFTWIVPGEGMQQKYRIILGESGKGVLWDSGVVESGRSVSVPYTGPALKPSKEYSWKVRVWTSKGSWNTKGAWSRPQVFKTAAELDGYATPGYPLVTEVDWPDSVTMEDGFWMVDFGKASFGWLEMDLFSETGGDTVTVHLGECLKDGRIWRKPTTTVRYQCHKVVLEKGHHTYRVEVTPDKRNTGPDAIKMPLYIGEVMPFRYCEIEGYSDLDNFAFARQSVHYPFSAEGSFSCTDDLLSRIWDMCLYSVKATSFTGIYIDGDRERIPYEADALINQLCHYAADREYTMARRSLEHLLEHPTWPTEWILQSVILAWTDYMYTGDERLLAREYDLLRAHCLEALRGPDGLISTRAGGQTPSFLESIRRKEAIRDIVDWPQKVPEVDGIPGGTDGFVFTEYNCVVNAYFYKALLCMEGIAGALGKDSDAAFLRSEAAGVRKAFNEAFLDRSSGRYRDGIGTEHSALHSNVFALAFGLVPEEYVGRVADYVVSKGMSCGVYVSQFLLDALYEAGRGEAAYSLMTSKGIPSWYNMLRVGATISLEAWDDSFKPNQDWNHIWGAAPGNVIPMRLMGVRPLEPGFSKALVAPSVATLEEASATVPTIRGNISVSVTQQSMVVDIPANMAAEVHVPMLDGSVTLFEAGPGRHVYQR